MKVQNPSWISCLVARVKNFGIVFVNSTLKKRRSGDWCGLGKEDSQKTLQAIFSDSKRAPGDYGMGVGKEYVILFPLEADT